MEDCPTCKQTYCQKYLNRFHRAQCALGRISTNPPSQPGFASQLPPEELLARYFVFLKNYRLMVQGDSQDLLQLGIYDFEQVCGASFGRAKGGTDQEEGREDRKVPISLMKIVGNKKSL